MLLRESSLAVLAGTMMALLAVGAHATTYTYTYTGNDFTQTAVGLPGLIGGPFPPFTTSDSVTGFFSSQFPLPANLNAFAATFSLPAVQYSFSDGLDTFSTSSLGGVTVSTDANGNIDAWSISFYFGGTNLYTLASEYGLGSPAEDIGTEGQGTLGENFNDPGVWTESINGVPVAPPPVPEPSTLMLVGSGVAGLLELVRRRAYR